MLSEHRFHSRRSRRSLAVLMLMSVLLAGAACDDDDDIINVIPDGPFELTFSLDASFQTPHGGQPIRIAVVRGGVVVAQASGMVSATQNPSFTFAAGAVLEEGITHEVHYWIDSNIGGGTPGICDPKAIDHQWSTEFSSPTNDVNFSVPHQPALTEDVCDTFD